MGWGAGNLGGGSGGGLNFKVVGNPQPANPTGNCIWVDTDTPISSWIFSPTQPSYAESGMVWIFTGGYGTTQINALKKNGIHLYLILAKQYISGEWVEKTAQIYQGGTWVDLWNGELYGKGSGWEDITGGWSVAAGAGTCSYVNGLLVITGRDGSSTTVTTNKKVNLSNFKTLYFTVNVKGFADYDTVAVRSTKTGANVASVYRYSKALGIMTGSLDISGIPDGEYYVVSYFENDRTREFGRIWLE